MQTSSVVALLVGFSLIVLAAGRPKDDQPAVQAKEGEKSKLNFAFLVEDQQYKRPAELSEETYSAGRQSSGYGRRRRRSPQEQPLTPASSRQPQPAAQESARARSGRDFGDIASILAIAGAKPVKVDFDGGYTRRKRSAERELHGLVPEVALHAVKIKSRGKNGLVAHESPEGAVASRAVFESLRHDGRRRRKRSRLNSLTKAEYDKRRVDTLKIEQNDALALPQRLRSDDTLQQNERPKRKF